MKIIEKLKERAKELKHETTAIYYAYQRKDVKKFPKLLILVAIGYALSPIDLIPDFIPVLGYLDDLIILPALLALSIKLIPVEIMDECRKKATTEPILLKKNWKAAFVVVSIWVIILIVIIKSIIT